MPRSERNAVIAAAGGEAGRAGAVANEDRGFTQAQAAKLMSVSQPRIRDLVRGRVHQFTVDSLIHMPTNAGVLMEVRANEKVA